MPLRAPSPGMPRSAPEVAATAARLRARAAALGPPRPQPRAHATTAPKPAPQPQSKPQQPTQSQPQPHSGSSASPLETLLGLERSARAAGSERELAFVMVNETRKLNGARQTLLLQRDRRGKLALTAASSVDAIDADAPFSRWIERLVAGLAADKGLQEAHDFALPAYCEPGDAENETYPFRNLLCIPLLDRAGSAFACLVCAREAPWLSTDTVISKWVAEAYAHAALALAGGGRAVTTRRLAIRSWHCAIGAVGVLILAALPVSMSALAPVEVIAMNPYVIAAPFEGVIDEVLVQPSAQVAGGDVLFRFVDITLRNKFDAAEKTAQVAEAKYRRSAQAAFADTQARHELTIAAAEMGQARAERDYAREMLDKGVVKAPMAGIAVFANKDDWKGRPVSTGEKVMLIAKPGETALRIDLPVKDAIVLADRARVKVFLDAAPLHVLAASVTHASYQAELNTAQQLAYRVRADFDTASDRNARIGARGTAEVFGETVPLALYLFRRPIVAVRQFLGI